MIFNRRFTFRLASVVLIICSAHVATAAGPTTLRVPIGGNYTVNADCTADDLVVNQLNSALFNTQALILLDHGKEFLFVVTTAGAPPIVSGSGRLLARRESDRDQ